MPSRYIIAGACLLTLTACGNPPVSPDPETGSGPADTDLTFFQNGTIYSGLPGSEPLVAVVVNGEGRIVQTVTRGESWEEGVDEAETFGTVIDLKGGFMFPGFVDAHAHLIGVGERELFLNLEGTASVAALVDRIRTVVTQTAPGDVIEGRGWIETGWPEDRMPTADDLDAVSPDNPVILVRADGHALVANTMALKAAGITNETPDPEGGAIEREPGGAATGILIDNAMGLALSLVPQPTDEDDAKALEKGAEVYAARGWTGMHNMSVAPRHAPILERLDTEGRLPIRLHNAYYETGFEVAAGRLNETDKIQNRAVKIYMDGALGSRGALLLAPYSDRPGTSGLSLMEPDALSALMQRAADADVQLAMHAIGDLANRRILDTFESSGAGAQKRWRIEHTQVLHPDDIARVGQLGLVASMQPSHAIGDLKFAPSRLGEARLAGAYAWADLLKAGARIAGGSDAPVEAGSPLIEFYAAVARKDLEGNSGPGWNPQQALSRQQALALFTSAPAYASFQDDDLGTIEPGKLADFTVFDRDLMTIDDADILTTAPQMTIVGGAVVWRAED